MQKLYLKVFLPLLLIFKGGSFEPLEPPLLRACCQVSTAWMRRVFGVRLSLQKTSLSMVARTTMHLPYLLLRRSQNQSKSRRTKQARKENSQSPHLLTKWKVSWRTFLKFSKSPRDDSWSLKNEDVNKKPSKKREDDGSKQNRLINEKIY